MTALTTRGRVRAALLASVATFALLAAGCDEADIVSTETLMERAQQSQAKGNLRAAAIDLKTIISREPNNAAARFQLARVYLRAGDGNSAEKEFNQAIANGMARDNVLPLLAQAWLQTRQYDKLLDEIHADRAASEIGKAANLALIGEAHSGEGDKVAAEESFVEALAKDPDQLMALIGLGKLKLDRGDHVVARELADHAATLSASDADLLSLRGDLAFAERNYPASLASYQEYLKIRPGHPSGILGAARADLQLGNYEDAAKLLDGLLRTSNTAYGYRLRALAAVGLKKPDDAVTFLNKSLDLNGSDLSTKILAGWIYYDTGQYELAASNLSTVVALMPGNRRARLLYAQALAKLGDADRAVEVLKPIADSDTDPVVLAMIGSAAALGGDLEASRAYLEEAVGLAPESAETWHRLGMVQVALGEEAGLESLEKAVELDPGSDADADLVLGHLKAGNLDEAIAAAKSWHERKPELTLPLTLMGIAYLAKGEEANARAALEQAVGMDPGDPAAQNTLAKLDLALGDVESARNRYNQVLTVHPDNIVASMQLSALESRAGQSEESIAVLQRALTHHPEEPILLVELGRRYMEGGRDADALDLMRTALAAAPNDPAALEVMGRAQLSMQLITEADRTFRALVAAMPNAAAAHYRLATALEAQGRWEDMTATLELALSLDPNHMPSVTAYGRLMAGQRQLETAKAQLAKLETAAPDAADTHDLRGLIAIAENKPDEAIAAYEAALSASPETPRAIKLARAYIFAGQADKAVESLAAWSESHPNDLVARIELGNLQLGAGQPDAAVATLKAVVDQTPDSPTARNNLAWAMLQAKDLDGALENARRATELAPDDPVIKDTLGVVLLERGDHAGALKVLREAAAALNSLEVQFHLGKALALNGLNDEAKAQLEKIVAATPEGNPYRTEAESLLKDLGG